MTPPPRLLFVYNADSGLLAALTDAIHKLVSPASYPCSLCATTYGAVVMRGEWKKYVRSLPYPADFLHRDEFRARYPSVEEPLPAVFLRRGDAPLAVLLGSPQLPPGQTVAELTAAMDAALASPGWGPIRPA